jgi:hypothetical protein
MPTPDVEHDLLVRLSELLPADVVIAGDVNAWSGPLRPTEHEGAEVFVQEFSGTIERTNDGAMRNFQLQVTTRSPANAYGEGHALARRIHDALDQPATPWVGASGAQYMGTRAMVAGPSYLGPDANDTELFGEGFEVWFAG